MLHRNIPETLRPSFINKFSWGSSTASYIGKTYWHFKVRASEHHGVFPRIGKPVKGTITTFIRDLMLVYDHKVVHEGFKFLGNECNRYLLELKKKFIRQKR